MTLRLLGKICKICNLNSPFHSVLSVGTKQFKGKNKSKHRLMNLNISTCVILLKKKRRKYEKGARIELRDSQIGGQATRQGGLGSIFRQKLGDATLGGQDGEMVQ